MKLIFLYLSLLISTFAWSMPQDSTVVDEFMCWDFTVQAGNERYGVRIHNQSQVIYLYKFVEGVFCVNIKDFVPGYYYITVKSADVEETIVASFTIDD